MSLAVPFTDLSLQWREIADAARPDIEAMFADSAFSGGRYVDAFETAFSAWQGAGHAIGCSSGTAALHLAVVAAGLGPGDEVLLPAHSFIATAWAPLYAGATPVLCEVDDDTATIDLSDAARRITSRTKAIIPVHLFGQPADLDAVKQLARRHGLVVIEDNAQSPGAVYNRRKTGAHGLMGCFSFYPGKNLGAAGEAGMVCTDDEALARRLRMLRNHGQEERYIHSAIGFNYRMDGFQGLVLRHKLAHLDRWTAERRRLAGRYLGGLQGLPLRLPVVRHQDHVWHLFVVRTPHRDALRAALRKQGIETALHYPVPLHRQPCLAGRLASPAHYPVADSWASEGLSLPLFNGMTDAQVDATIDAVRRFFQVYS